MPHGHADGRLRLRRTSLNVLFIAVLTVLAAAIYGTYSLYRYYQFNSGTYDLVIFDQAIHSYAHFRPGISIVKGLHNGFGPNFSVLGDHFSPILAALAPLYWIYNGPQDLLIAQAVLFALAVPPVWVFTRRALGGGARGTAGAYLVSVAYALSWPVAAAVDFDFHEAAFAPVLTAVALERLQAGRIRTALLALGLLLLVKEDMGLLVAGIGLVLVVARPHLNRQRLLGLALVIGGLAAAIVSLYVIIPAMGGRSDYYFAYGAFGGNVPQALLHMLEHPVRAATELISPRMKLDTMIWLVGAFGFLPLLSPITLAVVPLLLERMLSSSSSHWWGVQFHYNAFLVVVLVLAAVDGGARLGRLVRTAAFLSSRPARGAASGEPRRGPGGRPAGGGWRRLGGPACPRGDAPADRARDGPGWSQRRGGDGIAVRGGPPLPRAATSGWPRRACSAPWRSCSCHGRRSGRYSSRDSSICRRLGSGRSRRPWPPCRPASWSPRPTRSDRTWSAGTRSSCGTATAAPPRSSRPGSLLPHPRYSSPSVRSLRNKRGETASRSWSATATRSCSIVSGTMSCTVMTSRRGTGSHEEAAR